MGGIRGVAYGEAKNTGSTDFLARNCEHECARLVHESTIFGRCLQVCYKGKLPLVEASPRVFCHRPRTRQYVSGTYCRTVSEGLWTTWTKVKRYLIAGSKTVGPAMRLPKRLYALSISFRK